MGFYLDIAEIAGLLFVTYVVGWLVGYAAHRATVRTPHIETGTAAQATASPAGPDSDALVKAPVVEPVATTPPPVLAAATAIEPVKATAVPDTDAAVPAPEPAPAPSPVPVVSALDTLKSLSTAMPLMPASVQPTATEPPAAQILVAADVPTSPAPVETVEIAAIPGADIAPRDEPEPVPAAAAVELAVASPAEIAPAATAEPMPTTSADDASASVSLVATEEPVPELAAPSEKPVDAMPASGRPASPPTPASAPGVPWRGTINGHEAQRFVSEAGAAAISVDNAHDDYPEPDAALDVALLTSIADGLTLGEPTPSPAYPLVAEVPTGAAPAEPEPGPMVEPAIAISPAPMVTAAAAPSAEPAAPRAAEPVLPVAESAAPVAVEAPSLPPIEVAPPPSRPARRPVLDEDAAMRAIEGGWSRRDVRALGDAPELTDVTAAVSAAQVAVEQVLARNGVDATEPDSRTQAAFGKPAGLPQPREGRRDSLKRIEGLGPLDEVTLNNLGIYHFDQIAKWTEREVLWLENHAFAVGRIGREGWQEQARELLAERDATRALR